MRIPADCILLRGNDITVDEGMYYEDRETIISKSVSMGTLENNNHTANPDPFLLSKSLVLSGSGVALVCCVGNKCMISEIEPDIVLGEESENFTPL